jgi:hypothetical protein
VESWVNLDFQVFNDGCERGQTSTIDKNRHETMEMGELQKKVVDFRDKPDWGKQTGSGEKSAG